MPALAESSTVAEQIKLRRPRSQFTQTISETDPNPSLQIPPLIQSTRCKSSISSLLLSTFSNATAAGNETMPPSATTTTANKKKNNFSTTTLKGLGCTAAASQQVSVPAVIRTSADWQGKKTKKKKQKKAKSKTRQGMIDGSGFNPNSSFNSASCVDVHDVWCGPGIGFSTDAAASVDCVVTRRNVSGRGKIDGEINNHSQREHSCLARRTLNSEIISFLDSEHDLTMPRDSRPFAISGSRYYRNVSRRPSPEGIAEMMMFQSSYLMGGRLELHDQFRNLRLDVDDMSYEELLELGDRIGYVNTGLKEDEIGCCVSIVNDLSSNLLVLADRKCSICQEEFEADDEMGRLECGHNYHIECIKQWLARKNACPVCKTAVAVRH